MKKLNDFKINTLYTFDLVKGLIFYYYVYYLNNYSINIFNKVYIHMKLD